MPVGMTYSSFNPSPATEALQNRKSNYNPTYTSSSPIGDIFPQLQNEIMRSRSEVDPITQAYGQQRAGERSLLQQGLFDTVNQGLSSSMPMIEDRLGQLGILQSGALPEAIARQKAALIGQYVLPTLSQFDVNTFDTESQFPLQQYQREQGLRTGSIGREFGLEDIASQQNFQGSLADKYIQQQRLNSILQMIPALIGSGVFQSGDQNPLSGLFGLGGQAAGAIGGAASSAGDWLSGLFGGKSNDSGGMSGLGGLNLPGLPGFNLPGFPTGLPGLPSVNTGNDAWGILPDQGGWV